VTRATEARAGLEHQLADAGAHASTLEERVAELATELEQLREQTGTLRPRAEAADEAEQREDAAEAEQKRLKALVAGVRDELARANEDRAGLEEQLESAGARAESLDEGLAGARAEIEQLRDEKETVGRQAAEAAAAQVRKQASATATEARRLATAVANYRARPKAREEGERPARTCRSSGCS
jgi:chromosome segregation ATPase